MKIIFFHKIKIKVLLKKKTYCVFGKCGDKKNDSELGRILKISGWQF